MYALPVPLSDSVVVGCHGHASLLASWHARGGHGGHLHLISDMRMAISGTRFPFFTISIRVKFGYRVPGGLSSWLQLV